jgi:5'-3' exonuclease
MGIPSYYKRLIDRYPRLVGKGLVADSAGAGGRTVGADVLLMDFNCLIYQCVRAPGLPVYSEEGREAWEAALLEAVKKYVVEVWTVAGRPRQVLMAVDGVVPMAKMRQQRLRRFKSPWLAAREREAGVRVGETWDTNAITPGTEFMEKLGRALRSLATARGTGWTVSGADEPGEGEQKVMAWVRARAGELAGKQVAVYGLDADLIVLSLMTVATHVPGVGGWRLLRELQEFERSKRAEGSAQEYGTLDICGLLKILVPEDMPAAEYIREYLCAMSFLGNDFLPHSLSVKMREGGHDLMCRTLSWLHQEGQRLVGPDGRAVAAACAAFLRSWADAEEGWLCEALEDKYSGRGPPPRSDAERAMKPVQDLPLEWRVEEAIWSRSGGLVEGWREIYREKWLRGAGAEQVCGEYMQGLQWILEYYRGEAVSYSWYFPWNVPPLWGELVAELERKGAKALEAPAPTSPVAPEEQLAMVLPESSWRLVRGARLRALPVRAPWYWPREFGFFSAGKRWMWECEAEVPILTAQRMRELLA